MQVAIEESKESLEVIKQWRIGILNSMVHISGDSKAIPKYGYSLVRSALPSEFNGMDFTSIAEILLTEATSLRKYS